MLYLVSIHFYILEWCFMKTILEKRVAKLEELCKQMNTNISSLQSIVNALQKNDYITNVSPVRKDGEVVGYTITFAHSDTITIYHGTNGKDGANGKDGKDGKDGYTPQIGVMKDTDGIYYWTVDGEWLLDGKGNKIKAVGEDGRDGQDGTNGSNGTDGKDGNDGADGITPRLKIENDYWYVSYDNGATWTELGKATGENGVDGIDGKDGKDGVDGAIGPQGPQGEQGIQGPQGADGKSNYFHIAYANDVYGNGYNQVGGDYVATYVDNNPEDDQTKFTNWMPFKGAQGEKGDQGIAGTDGTNGVDGTTYYLHIGYASDENGTDFSHD